MSDPIKQVINILTQCRDTLEWQVGNGVPAVDFLYPKIKYALTLLELDEDKEFVREERSSGDELRAHVATFDFLDNEEEDN